MFYMFNPANLHSAYLRGVDNDPLLKQMQMDTL